MSSQPIWTRRRLQHSQIDDVRFVITKFARDRILDCNRYDVVLVEHARTHLARRISGYPGDFEKDLVLFRKLNALFQQGVRIEDFHRIEYDALT